MGALLVCPECANEWIQGEEGDADEDAIAGRSESFASGEEFLEALRRRTDDIGHDSDS